MKKDGLLAEIINAVVQYERKKVRNRKPDYCLNQKKQLWYGMMNQVDEDPDENPAQSAAQTQTPPKK